MMGLPSDAQATPLFLLPTRVERLRGGVEILLERMLHTSAYHEAFMLRGIYLTDGGGPPAPATKPGAQAAGATDVAPKPGSDAAIADLEGPTVQPAATAADAPAPATDQPRPRADQGAPFPPISQRLFDSRIFVETGLAQPAYGEMTRPTG